MMRGSKNQELFLHNFYGSTVLQIDKENYWNSCTEGTIPSDELDLHRKVFTTQGGGIKNFPSPHVPKIERKKYIYANFPLFISFFFSSNFGCSEIYWGLFSLYIPPSPPPVNAPGFSLHQGHYLIVDATPELRITVRVVGNLEILRINFLYICLF